MKNNIKKILNIIIPDYLMHERLDLALAKILPDYSRTQIKEWIELGAVLVNGTPVKAKTKVRGGESISVEIPEKALPQWKPQAIPLSIVYEDEALLIINKPVGLVVHPGAGNADSTLLNALLHHAESLRALPRAGILHRLDKDTSGLLTIAKTPAAFKHLTQQLKNRTLLREYQAIVCGHFISGGKIDAPISRHPLQRKRMAVVETGKEAVTHYRVMEKYRAHTRVKVRLETGRTHQIRVHMAYVHHPLVGDKVYGGRLQLAKGMSTDLIHELRRYKRQALHAYALGLQHPITEEMMRFEVDLPDDMQKLIEVLKKDLKE